MRNELLNKIDVAIMDKTFFEMAVSKILYVVLSHKMLVKSFNSLFDAIVTRHELTQMHLCKSPNIEIKYRSIAIWLLLSLLVWMSGFTAVSAKGLVFDPAPIAQPSKAPLPFDIIGYLEDAKLDIGNVAGTCSTKTDDRLAGGTAKINGITVIIPCNTIVQMPATALTWADLFYYNPAQAISGFPQTGLALVDTDTSPLVNMQPYNGILPSNEVHIQGNIVDGRYIAGLVFVSQEFGNNGQGTIVGIDYKLGQLLVSSSVVGEVVRVRINDPIGRFGKVHTALNNAKPNAVLEEGYDPRFTADTDNPTIHAVTGYPMCIPRSNPFNVNEGDDLLCPESNRPRSPNCPSLPATISGRVGFQPFVLPPAGQYCRQFVMAPPSTASANCSGPTCPTDPTRQAPFEIGDFITYSGTIKTDVDAKNVPYAYISAHTIVANLGIYTAPGVKPAYVTIEGSLVGTNALPLANLPQETTSQARIEGFTTDPTQLVDIFMVDVESDGTVSDRLIGTENPGLPPVVGRFRFRPVAGNFGPFTRDIRAVSRTACRLPVMGKNYCASTLPLTANGLKAGQFRAPNFEFIFPEPVRTGDPMVPNNFQDLFFLYCSNGQFEPPAFDEGAAASGAVVGTLDPVPWAEPMTRPMIPATLNCKTTAGAPLPLPSPIVTVSPDQSVLSNATVTITGTATDPTGAALSSYKWTQIAGTPVTLSQSGSAASSKLTFKAPTTQGVLTFALSVTNATGMTGVAKVSVAVNPDSITITNANYDNRSGKGVLTVTAVSSLPATTTGLTLSVQANFGTFSMASAAQTMSKVANSTANPAICPAASNPCWRYTVTGVIKNTLSPAFVAPNSITVTSTMGGKATMTSGDPRYTIQ